MDIGPLFQMMRLRPIQRMSVSDSLKVTQLDEGTW